MPEDKQSSPSSLTCSESYQASFSMSSSNYNDYRRRDAIIKTKEEAEQVEQVEQHWQQQER